MLRTYNKTLRYLLLTIMLFSVVLFVNIQAQSATGAYGTAVIDNKKATKVHLRSFPSMDSESLGLYFTGTQVLCESDPSEEWTLVRIGSHLGYIKSEFLSMNIPEVQSKQPVAYLKGRPGKVINIYAAPSTQASISATAKSGDTLIVQGETKSHWYYVQVNEVFGYIEVSAVSLEKTQNTNAKPPVSSNNGAYTKEMLSTDFTNSSRAFYSLAVIHAPNAAGAYFYDLLPEQVEQGFLYNGCIVKCVYPPENGWVLVETHLTLGSVREEDLSFNIKNMALEFPTGQFIRETKLYNEPIIKDYAPGIDNRLESCHLLGMQWDYEHKQKFYFVETQSAYGYVPIQFVEQGSVAK